MNVENTYLYSRVATKNMWVKPQALSVLVLTTRNHEAVKKLLAQEHENLSLK